MVAEQDKAKRGVAYNPTPGGLASTLHDRNPRADDIDELDIPRPLPHCWTIRPWADNQDRRNHLEFHPAMATKHRRIYGQNVQIEECEAEGAITAFNLEILRRVNYRAADTIVKPDLFSRLYFAVSALSANFLVTDPCSVMLGDAATGVVTANYNGSGRAAIDSRRPVSMSDWRLASPNTSFPGHFGDFDEWADEWTLALSGLPYAIDEPGRNPITGSRICPPGEGPCLFIRNRRARINAEDVLSALNPRGFYPPPSTSPPVYCPFRGGLPCPAG